MKVYVGCSLTQAPESFKQFVADLKSQLNALTGVEVLEFLGLVAGTSADVYTTDLGNVETCDAFVAMVDEPSIGLGMEIQHATRLNKPTLCLYREGGKVTRMLHGAHELDYLELQAYSSDTHALELATAFLTR